VIAILLLYLLWPSRASSPPPEPVPTDVAATLPPPTPATYATPVQPPTLAAPVAATTNVDVSQLHLVGILSRGAVIAMADGSQHFVAVGREVAPGVTLRAVEVHHAILATPSGEVRLGFDAAAQPQAAAPPATVRPGP
jgi:hypothetical protein